MENQKVYLEKCNDYNLDIIEEILEKAIRFLGIRIPVSCSILLKPNILGIYPPEQHITTHPVVVEAIARIFLKRKNTLFLGDSSGNAQYGNTTHALKKSGMSAIGKKYGFYINAFDKHGNRVFKNKRNYIFKQINLSTYIDEVDYIVNIPKLKSHTFLSYTGAVKNFYGCIPGAGKPYGHLRAPGQQDFSHGLLDIYCFIKPKLLLNIIDGITGLEGAGPGPAGKIKNFGFIGVSQCALSLDSACLEILGKNPADILTHRFGIKRGLFTGKIIKNKSLSPVSFDMPKGSIIESLFSRFIPGLALSKPYVMKSDCIQCRYCIQACPVSAISLDNYPVFDYKKCIYCFCCHENCPEGAITLKENIFFRIFKNLGNKQK